VRDVVYAGHVKRLLATLNLGPDSAPRPSAPSSPITEWRLEGEEAIDVGTTSEGKSANGTGRYICRYG
jgi:hypothetical protein